MIRQSSLMVAVLAATLMGCSENSNKNGDPSLGTPPFQKGLSQADQAEFLATMDQFNTLNSVYREFNFSLVSEAISDIRQYAFENVGATGLDQTPSAEYVQVLNTYLRGCKTYRRTDSNASGSVSEVIGWMEQDINAAQNCQTEASWNQRNVSSKITKWESVSRNSQGLSLSFAENNGSFRQNDIVAISAGTSTENIVKKPEQKYSEEGLQKTNQTFSGNLVFASGEQAKVDAIEVVESRSMQIDDNTTRGIRTRLLKLVFNGTANPVVYERFEQTAVNGKKTTKVTLNGDIIHETK